MIDDGEYAGVVDRIEEGIAVVLLEEDGDVFAECHLDPETLPEEGRHEGAVCRFELECGEVIDVTYRSAETSERKERAQRRFDRLSRRPDESRDRE